MRLELDLKIIPLGLLFFIFNKIDIYLIFLLFIIFHEIAHLVVGIIFGMKPKLFSINPLGVSLEFYFYKDKNIFRKIATYLAGPIFNLIVAIIVMFGLGKSELEQKILYTNFLLGIFNLIPILPLDGGKILKEILSLKLGNKNANVIMGQITKFILVIITFSYSILILKMKNFALFLLIIYLWYLEFWEDKKIHMIVKAYDIIEENKYKDIKN